MAFNPFHAFRKHQKVLFAILTIVCMIVFILQFGRGDMFESLLGRTGGGRGDKVVTLYGRGVTTGDLDLLKQSRQVANGLVFQALEEAAPDAGKAVHDYNPDKPDQIDDRLKTLIGSLDGRFQLLQFMPIDSVLQEVRRNIADVNGLLAGPADSAAADQSKVRQQKETAAKLRLLLKQQYIQLTGFAGKRDPFYFGGGVKPEDLLDFEIWKHQADKLGVVLTKADARRAVAHEAGDLGLPENPGGSWAADPALKDFLAKQRGTLTEDQIATAVADEFRVRIAQRLMGGPASGVAALDDLNRAPPDPLTPFDFWTFYRDNRTTVKVAILPIAVESFEDKVQQHPSETELQDLFADHRSAVPVPDSPTPGFKEPRRMKVEFVTASGDTPYYKDRAHQTTFDPARFYLTAAVGPDLAGGGVPAAAALAALLDGDPLKSDYEREYGDQNRLALSEVRHLFGVGFGGLPAFAAPADAAAAADEQAKEKVRMASNAFQSAAGNGAAGTPFAEIGLAAASVPIPRTPDETVRQVAEAREKDALSRIVEDDMEQFGKDLADKIKSFREEAVKKNAEGKTGDLDPEKYANEKAAQFVRETAKARGWELNDKAGLDDRYQVETDDALKTMRDAVMAKLFNPRDPRPPSVADLLFKQFPPGLYVTSRPINLPAAPGKMLVFWRSEDQREHELSYEEARPRVLAAWKLQEAHKLVLREVERINAEAQRQAAPVEAVKYLRDQNLGAVFELPEAGRPGVARLVPAPSFNAGVVSTFSRYTIPTDKIPYPPDKLVDRLLDLDKPGKTLIFQDRPWKTFYLAVLEERSNPEFKDRDKDTGFMDAYRDASQPGKDELWRRFFLPERERRFQNDLMRQLRAEAGEVNDKGQFVLAGKPQQAGQPQPEEPSPPEGGEGNDLSGL